MTREEAIARIKALRARASDEASSEAEASAAAVRAAKIIAQFEVTEAELIERGTAGVTEAEHNAGRRYPHPTLEIAACSIGRFTECHPLWHRGANVWVGQPEDVEFALYLCEMIQNAAERSYQCHWKSRWYQAPNAHYRKSYLTGFGLSIVSTLERMVTARCKERTAQGGRTDLVVVKAALIGNYMAETYPDIKERDTRKRKEPNLIAYVAGCQAGHHVNLNRPIGEAPSVEQIGGAACA